MRVKRILYGWRRGRYFLVSKSPPDAPVRPAWLCDSVEQATAVAERKRAELMWWPAISNGDRG